MQWTKAQHAAINSRDKNLLVAAAAGSGKTAVLVERIIKMILDGDLSVDRMLVVTFTNAAAQEMRTRIHKKIFERMQTVDDSEQLATLERQAILLTGASIMTFHSFCLSVLRRNFSKINFDPKFREGGEQELNILKQEVIEELFEKKYSEGDADFIKFTDELGGNMHGDAELHKLITNLYEFSQSRPYPEKWLNSIVNFYENPETATFDDGKLWLDTLINFALERASYIVEDAFNRCLYAKNICYAQIVDTSNVSKKDAAAFLKNWEKVKNIFNADFMIIFKLHDALNDWDKFSDAWKNFPKFDNYPGRGNLPDDLLQLKKNLKDIRDRYKDNFDKLPKDFNMSRADILTQIKNLLPSVRQLIKTTIDFDRAFTRAKRERGIIDFDDMEHLALEILTTDNATAENYRQKFQMILVDEYQDTNGVQEEIISRIVDEKNFFAVGDVKQSIYRFRTADPKIFMAKYDAYPQTPDCERIDLSTNFRSRRQVVNIVNVIFRLIMTRNAMEIDYNEDAELYFGAHYPAYENIFDEDAEFLIINLEDTKDKKTSTENDDDDDSDKPDSEELDKLGLEIQVIADKINKMIDDKKNIWDKDLQVYRPITYKDIVILMRAVDGRSEKIIDVMNKNGIPAYAADKGGYFRAQEIQTTLNLLTLLDNSRQDIPLAAVMLSPIGGFNEQDLADLRISDRKADFFTLVKNFSAGESELAKRCKNFLDKLNGWREIARQVSVPELLTKIYRETGYYDYFGTTADGRVAQANLRMLIDRAAEFESTAFRGLSRFVQFIKKIRELENDLSSARTLGENEDVVRVMTIHKSKGLEFPVVFVAQLGKNFNTTDSRGVIIRHQDLGVGIYTAQQTNYGLTRTSNFVREIIRRKHSAELLAEELRILYVAFTRAREKLFIVGTVKNDAELDKVSDDAEFSPVDLQSAKNPMDWLIKIYNSIEEVANIKIYPKSEITLGTDELLEKEKEISTPPEVAEDSPITKIPAKLSVTEVKRRIAEFEDEPVAIIKTFAEEKSYRRPNFMQTIKISAAEFGTLMHRVMQHLNLSGKLDEKNISAQIDSMVAAQIFTVEQGDAVKRKVGKIAEFFAGELGQRIINAAEIYRELPFSQQIDAATINAGENFKLAAGEKIFVQGIIDVLFKDSATGNWVLLDYKTNRDNSEEYFQREYREQIRLYVQAAETLTGIKIAEKYLYLLSAGKLINM